MIIAQYTGSGKARDAGNTASQSVLICTSQGFVGLFTVIFSRPLCNALWLCRKTGNEADGFI